MFGEAVHADEMLSDEYFEQDGGDQSESLNHHRVEHSIGFSSKPPTKPVARINTLK